MVLLLPDGLEIPNEVKDLFERGAGTVSTIIPPCLSVLPAESERRKRTRTGKGMTTVVFGWRVDLV